MNTPRSSGVLLHPTSLPGPYGVGDIGPAAARFIDWLSDAGQSVWQVLPLGPTGYGDSPYASLSSFAGNELLVSPDLLARDGLITQRELLAARVPAGERVDYGEVLPRKRALLRLAASRAIDSRWREAEREEFVRDNAFWLDDYALFSDIKAEYDAKASAEGRPGSAWNEAWPASLANRDAAVLASRRETNAASLRIVEVEQFLFRSQWDELRSHALARGVRIIGDLPIFVAMDSADAWAHPHLFQLNDRGQPTFVAGVPPDYFSADGQLWGNPLYAWENHEADGFSWWLARVEAALSLYDILRIDHFRGLAACWAVPAAATTAKSGSWEAAPGERLLTALKTRLGGELPIIAEDLGFITDDVRKLRDDFGLPGMRILQFGFDARESGNGLDPANPFLPHNYPHHCVVYTGTHDNDTLAGWLSGASTEELAFVRSYLGYEPENLVMAIVREAMKSAANTCVIPMQDILGLGRKARMNVPGTSGGNWTWRLSPQALDGTVAASMRALSQIYSRSGPVGPGPVQGAPRLT